MSRAGRLLCFVGLILAAAALDTRAEADGPKIRTGLDLEYEYFSYAASLGGERVDDRNAFTAKPRLDWSPGAGFLLHASVLMRKDRSEEERSRVYLFDGSLGVLRERWSLNIGREILSWGRTDSLRPTDVFQRHDWTDLIEDRVEATSVVRFTYSRGRGTLEAVWAPVFTRDIVSYADDNRWTGLPDAGDVPGVGTVSLTFDADSRQRPPATLASGQGGIRFSGTAGGWDYAFMGYYGYDRVPTFTRMELETVDPVARTATVRLVPAHKRIAVVGGDFAKAVSRWTLRGESAYTRTADLDPGIVGFNDPYLRFTGGADRSFSSSTGPQSASIGLQYAYDSEPKQAEPLATRDIDPLLHPFRHALAVNAQIHFTDALHFNLKGCRNLVERDYLLQEEFVWKPSDAMTIIVGADALGGRPDTFFGRYRKNDRLRIRIAFSF